MESSAATEPGMESTQGPRELHLALTRFNQRRLAPSLPDTDEALALSLSQELGLRALEIRFLEKERAMVTEAAALAPTEPNRFVEWFEALEQRGPGQGDRLFPFLAQRASLGQLRWFLFQEIAGEAGFDDLVAMTLVKLPTRAKLELARNFWDEMGRGNPSGMHGPMLERLANELGLTPTPEAVVWEALALGNLMVGLAANRRYTYHSLGALGAIELTAPGRAVQVVEALKRLDVSGQGRHYFQLHSTLDLKHSADWNREVLGPLVAEDPARARALAEGALMRLRAGLRCFDRYREGLGVDGSAGRGGSHPSRISSARS